MSIYKKGRIPKMFISNKGEFRKLDDDIIRYLNGLDENLDILLNRGLNFSDNFDAVEASYTSNAVADTQDTVAHTLGKTPSGVIVVDIDKGGVVYRGSAHDSNNLYLKCTVASASVKLLVY